MNELVVDRPPHVDRRTALREAARAVAGAVLPALPAGYSSRPAMRRSLRAAQSFDASALPPAPALGAIVHHRLAFGPRPGDMTAWQALGADDDARLVAWVDQQLNPTTINDAAANTRMAASSFTTLNKSLVQLWQDHHVSDPPWEIRQQPFYEVEMATFVRAIHSKRQLFERMVEFWHNHFSVYGHDFLIGPTWAAYDRDVIRANALGNFRTLLEAVTKSNAMLYYLNNSVNSVDGPNENYSREVQELHTLGAENYFGAIPASQVPRDGTGRAIGYCDEDVTAVARCLTGWTLRDRSWDPSFGNTGEFFYHAPWHDTGAKTFLGINIPAGQPAMKDGRDVLDILATHPGTAKFICKKLCRRFVADQPPQSLVDAAVATFLANTGAPDQMKRVMRTIALSAEFKTTWGQKTKRPFEAAVGMFRAAGGDLPFRLDDNEATSWFSWMFYQTGHPLFQWHPPNGYPDIKEAWKTTSPKVMTWRLANMLVQVDDAAGQYYLNVIGQTPANVRTAWQITTFWTERLLGYFPPTEEFEILLDFMAQGRNPHVNLPFDTDEDTRHRVRALVAVIFMSPSFHFR